MPQKATQMMISALFQLGDIYQSQLRITGRGYAKSSLTELSTRK